MLTNPLDNVHLQPTETSRPHAITFMIMLYGLNGFLDFIREALKLIIKFTFDVKTKKTQPFINIF